jgi:alpha-glucoside transport system substrate-binding protein
VIALAGLTLVLLAALVLRPGTPMAVGCPGEPWPMMSAELTAACTGAYAGRTVYIISPGIDPEVDRFEDTVQNFEAWTGIDIRYESARGFELNVNARVEAGIPSDLIALPQPGLLRRFVEAGAIIDLGTFLHPQWLATNYDPEWLALAQVEGITAGVWWRYAAKSLIWYARQPFQAAGYVLPATWEDLLALSDQIVADGGTPWCVGLESGVATGWPATDWIEDILLRTTSLANYDRWTSPASAAERLPFTSAEVRNAAEQMARIFFTDGYVFGGRGAIPGIAFSRLPTQLLNERPGCYLIKDSSNIINYMPAYTRPGLDYDFFPFPMIDPAYANPLLISGNISAMFNDRPEVRAVVDFLSRGESIRAWLGQGGALAPHRDARPDWYANDLEREIAALVAQATAIRFDGSDLMPAEVGTAAFWRAMTDWVIGTVDLDTALTQIDAAWPAD